MGLLINALARIKTSFLRLKDFWDIQLQESQYLAELNTETGESIRKLQRTKLEVYLENSKEQIQESTLRWITLFKINHDAFTLIQVFITLFMFISYFKRM